MRIIFLAIIIFALLTVIANAQFINAPTELEAQAESPLYVKLSWYDNSNNEEGFYIERSSVNDPKLPWEIIGSVPQNVRIYYDYWITHHRKYYYRVFAYNDSAWSDYSNIDSVLTLGDTTYVPNAPSNLRVTNTTQTSITIQWDDNSKNENGFIIARKKQGNPYFEIIDSVGTDILTYQEVGLTPDNIYYYKVCAFNGYGISDYSNTVFATNNNFYIPDKFFLGENYPNPFNPSTTIKFGIPSNSFVSIKIYNSLGEEVVNLVSQNFSPGIHEVKWNAKNFTSGMYFYRIETQSVIGGFTNIKKMILIK